MARTRAHEALRFVATLSVLFLLAACSSAPAATRAAGSAPAATRAASAIPTASAPGGWVNGSGSTSSKKCGGLGGDWVIEWHIEGASDKLVATIDKTTLTGPYTEITWQTYDVNGGAGSIATATHGGTASLVVQADGSVVMTTKGGQEDTTLTGIGGGFTSTPTGSTTDYPWRLAVDECKGT